jgi:hypothetical protein
MHAVRVEVCLSQGSLEGGSRLLWIGRSLRAKPETCPRRVTPTSWIVPARALSRTQSGSQRPDPNLGFGDGCG